MPVEIQPSPGPALADWNLLRSFIAIHETGSLTAAAQRLKSTQPTIGRHLRELESELGETLFTRLPGRLEPTERAQALLIALMPMRHAARDAARLFTEDERQIRGVVRLSVAEVYGFHVVPEMLAPLLSRHPELEIELVLSNSADSLFRREADIAIRFFRPTEDGLIVRKLGETELGLYVHHDLLARDGEPPPLQVPPHWVLAGFDRDRFPIESALRGSAPPGPLRFRLRSDSALAREAIVEAGAGVAMYFTDIAAARPGLRRLWPRHVALRQEVWLCAHDELRRSARMRCVWDGVGDALQARLARAG